MKIDTSVNCLHRIRVMAGREHGVIDKPCVCIFGTTIYKHYYGALSMKMLSNGFFARMLAPETAKRSRSQETPGRDMLQKPNELRNCRGRIEPQVLQVADRLESRASALQ